MALSYSLDHVPSSTESVLVEVAAKTEMTLQSNTTDQKTGEQTCVYVLASGDMNFPATVTYRSAIQNRSDGKKRRVSMTFSTWATTTDSVAGTDSKKEISSTISLLLPADATIELADVDDLIGVTFSWMYLSQSSGARDTTWLQKLLYGVPQVK